MVIVRTFPFPVEQLAANPALLPSVDELRPASCPHCHQPARPPGEPLGIVGHGTFTRQALGLAPAHQVTTPVRRYNCRGCPHTLSILPDELYPGRWYTSAAILLSLWLTLTKSWTSKAVRQRFGSSGETEGWKTVRRWRRSLAQRLWSWVTVEASDVKVTCSRKEGRRLLRRLLGHAGFAHTCSEEDVAAAARTLTREWPADHTPGGVRDHDGSG
jgi:hypothetical protein